MTLAFLNLTWPTFANGLALGGVYALMAVGIGLVFGVLLVDHNVALVLKVCERIHVLDQGKTLAEGTPQEIRAHLGVAAAYLGESADAEEIE